MAIELHRWTNRTGDEWACIAYDHGPMCRRCQPVDGALSACLANVEAGFFEIVGDDPITGEFRLRVTDAGNRRIDQLMTVDSN